jgi:N-acyl-phosphatidylethanolamine-hydrolysing phospholipase D
MPRPPHHLANGRFTNPWPGGQLHGFKDLLKWVLVDRIRNPPPPDPDPNSIPRVGAGTVAEPIRHATTRPISAESAKSADDFSVAWLGHSTVLLHVAGKWILTDPIWSHRASPVQWAGPKRWVPPELPLEALPPLDLILLSHNHYDHCDRPTIEWLAQHQSAASWVCPLRLSPLLRTFGVKTVTELDWWDTTDIGGIKVTATPAQHFSSRTFWDRNATLWSGFVIAAGDRRVYFAGDTGYHPEFAEIGKRCGPFDLALIPVGAYEPRWFMQPVHMNPEDAIAAVRDIASAHPDKSASHVVPIHWGTYKLTDEPMDEPPKRFARRWAEAGLPEERLWVLAHGEMRGLKD